jgi:hypothetical protein
MKTTKLEDRRFTESFGNYAPDDWDYDKDGDYTEYSKDISDYTEGMGYSDEDIKAISELEIDYSYTNDNLNRITRTK